ncbi:hypothetical protein [Chitinivorax sp. B]|uniref:hypothetical protein n=1 Tax=Chitinivorax sp. B TaxID=2502235 RepID=UPI0014857D11|nr:hypothetical protein [Chitinivorax sp. B]
MHNNTRRVLLAALNITLQLDQHPAAWAALIDELRDAHQHLGKLIDQLNDEHGMSEADFSVHLGQVYAHLNRAWHHHDRTNLHRHRP